jgi:hypothetical protein
MLNKCLPWLSLSLLGLLAGCAALPPVGQAVGQPQALVLLRDITIRPGHTRAFLQDGEVKKRFNEFRTHCALEIRDLSDKPRTVPAGFYPIRRIQQSVTPIVLAEPGRKLASASFAGRLASSVVEGGDMEEDIFEGYHFWLRDTANVGLMRMTCYGVRAQPVDAEPPTRAEIAQALGKLGRLQGGSPR